MERKSLKPVVRVEKDSVCRSMNYRSNLNDISFISTDDIHETYPLLFPSVVTDGQVYLKSPYDDKYILIDNYEMEIVQKKTNYIEIIAGILGAKHVEVDIESFDCKKRVLKFSIGANTDYYSDIKMNSKSDYEQQLKQKLKVRTDYTGTVPTQSDYDDAEQFAKDHNLFDDSSVQTLLSFRNPNRGNMVERKQVFTSLYSELNTVMDIAANLSVLDGVIAINSNFMDSVSIKKVAEMRLDITFLTE